MRNLKIKMVDIWCLFAIRQLTKNEVIEVFSWFNHSVHLSMYSIKDRLSLLLIQKNLI
jgi:hypothetical protein